MTQYPECDMDKRGQLDGRNAMRCLQIRLAARDAEIAALKAAFADARERESRLEMRCLQWYEAWIEKMGKDWVPDLPYERGIYEAGRAVIDGVDVAGLPPLPVEEMAAATIAAAEKLEAKAASAETWKARAEKAEKERDSALWTCRILGSLPSDLQVVTCRAEKAEAACLAWYKEWIETMGKDSVPDFRQEANIYAIGKAVAERGKETSDENQDGRT